MVFGEVECDACRHRRCNVLLAVFFAVAVHIDVQSFVGDIVAVHTRRVVIVADGWRPLALVQVFQLHHEPRHLAVVMRVAESSPDGRPARVVYSRSYSRGSSLILRHRRPLEALRVDRLDVLQESRHHRQHAQSCSIQIRIRIRSRSASKVCLDATEQSIAVHAPTVQPIGFRTIVSVAIMPTRSLVPLKDSEPQTLSAHGIGHNRQILMRCMNSSDIITTKHI